MTITINTILDEEWIVDLRKKQGVLDMCFNWIKRREHNYRAKDFYDLKVELTTIKSLLQMYKRELEVYKLISKKYDYIIVDLYYDGLNQVEKRKKAKADGYRLEGVLENRDEVYVKDV